MMSGMHSCWKSPWWAAGAATVPAGLLLYGVIVPGGYHDPLVAGLWGWAVVGVAWLVTGTASREHSPASSRWRLWPLLVVPAVFAASWWVASGDLVGRAAFAYYRSDLERLADRVPVNEAVDIGPYSFYSVDRADACVLYHLRGPGMAFLAAGFAWCPGSTPVGLHRSEDEVFQPFVGDWYVFVVRYDTSHAYAMGVHPWGLHIITLKSTPDV